MRRDLARAAAAGAAGGASCGIVLLAGAGVIGYLVMIHHNQWRNEYAAQVKRTMAGE